MDKILIEVYSPILGKAFDIFIPRQSQLFEVLDLIKKAVTEMSDGLFSANENTALCDRATGIILDLNLFVYESTIHNGSKLILI